MRPNYRQGPDSARVPRLLALSGITAVACVVAVGAITWVRQGTLSDRVLLGIWQGWRDAVWEPWFGIFIVGLWLLQWRYPARRQERPLGQGLVQDLGWFLLSPVLAVTVISAYLVLLGTGRDRRARGPDPRPGTRPGRLAGGGAGLRHRATSWPG